MLCSSLLFLRFQLTRLLRGATSGIADLPFYRFCHFNSHASCEARLTFRRVMRSRCHFNSHASCEARRVKGKETEYLNANFNSHASCEARQVDNAHRIDLVNFNSHASCEARRTAPSPARLTARLFQLTRLLRGATIASAHTAMLHGFQLTRLLRGATLLLNTSTSRWRISTHTPLARRDRRRQPDDHMDVISTHTPLARRDRFFHPVMQLPRHFNSHASCEARPASIDASYTTSNFNSHASCEARRIRTVSHSSLRISTHTPLARRDAARRDERHGRRHFNSHASCEARPVGR